MIIFDIKRKKSLICGKPGDLILWDSRTIHCNTPPLIDNACNNQNEMKQDEKTNSNNIDFIRLASYVCMTPKSKANETTIYQRILAYQNFESTNHIPHEFHLTDSPDCNIFLQKKLEDLNEIGRSLIGI